MAARKEKIRTHGAVSIKEYEWGVEALRRYALRGELEFRLRDLDDEQEVAVAVERLDTLTSSIEGFAEGLSEPGERLIQTWERVEDYLHEKYNHPVIALQFMALGDAGVISIEHAMHLHHNEVRIAEIFR